jgi:hypothetical protein
MGILAPDRGGRGISRALHDEIFTKLIDQLSFAGPWIKNHLDGFIQSLHAEEEEEVKGIRSEEVKDIAHRRGTPQSIYPQSDYTL